MTAQADHAKQCPCQTCNCYLEPATRRKRSLSCLILYPLVFLALATIFWAKLQGVSKIGHIAYSAPRPAVAFQSPSIKGNSSKINSSNSSSITDQPQEMSTLRPTLVRPVVLLFGDSLTQYSLDPEGGWGAALAHHLQRRVDVVQRALAGYNSRQCLAVFHQVLQQVSGRQVALLTIWLGANDAAIPGRSAEAQHVPVSEYRGNLESLVAAARQAGITNILLITPPPVHDEGRVQHQQQTWGITSPVLPNKSLAYTQHYASAVLELGHHLSLPVVDLYSGLQSVPGWQTELLRDGLHFTPAGSRAVWQAVKAVLDTQLPQLGPESMPVHFPLWDQLDHANFEQYWSNTITQLAGSTAGHEVAAAGAAGAGAAADAGAAGAGAAAAAAGAAGAGAAAAAAAGAAGAGPAGAEAPTTEAATVPDNHQVLNSSHVMDYGQPAVVLFGDSLTQYSLDPEGGWGAALAHHLQRRVDVISRGHSGYNSRWGLKLFHQVLQQVSGQQVALLTIWLGANDAAIPGRSAEAQHVPVSEYRGNLESMVAAARQAGITNILLITPPPVHDEGRIQHQQQKLGIDTPVEPDRTLAYTQQYASAVLDLGHHLSLPVVDLYSGLQSVPGWQTELLKDGLHFTPAGSRAVWQAVKGVIDAQMTQLRPEALSVQFQEWDDPRFQERVQEGLQDLKPAA